MARKFYINSFSQKLFFITAVIYLIDLLTFGRMGSLFMLKPSLVISNHEFWRLLTFPFAFSTPEGTALFAYTFLLVAPKLERMLPRNLFPMMFFIILFLQSAALSLAFWKTSLVFTGMECLSFFVLSLYVILNLGKRSTYYYSPLKSVILTLLVVIVWFSSVLLHSYIMGKEIMAVAVAFALFGIGGGLFTFIQLLFAKKLTISRKHASKPEVPEPEELRLAVVSQLEKKYSTKLAADDYLDDLEEFVPNEERLNAILDKISESGKDSLTPEELHYLQEYSKKL